MRRRDIPDICLVREAPLAKAIGPNTTVPHTYHWIAELIYVPEFSIAVFDYQEVYISFTIRFLDGYWYVTEVRAV